MTWYVYDTRTQMTEFEAAFKEEHHARFWIQDHYGPNPDFIILTKQYGVYKKAPKQLKSRW